MYKSCLGYNTKVKLWWGSSYGAQRSVENTFVAITPRSTLTWRCRIFQGFIYGSHRSFWKLLVLDWNIWNHITVKAKEYYYYYYYLLLESFSQFKLMVWVTASLFKSTELFSVFCLFSIMLSLGWSPLILQPPRPPVSLIILWWLYQKHQLQLV